MDEAEQDFTHYASASKRTRITVSGFQRKMFKRYNDPKSNTGKTFLPVKTFYMDDTLTRRPHLRLVLTRDPFILWMVTSDPWSC